MNKLLRLPLLALLVLLAACSQTPMPTPPPATLKFGAYTQGAITQGLTPILELENELGRRLDAVHWYAGWERRWDDSLVAPLRGTGREILITWENPAHTAEDVAAGVHDEYIRTWAAGMREHAETIYLRPFPEMNGNPTVLVNAWRRMHAIFMGENAVNVKWVWTPDTSIEQPSTEDFYPGHEFVDVLALSGFNWGATKPDTTWRSFEETFLPAYDRITQQGDQPVWIVETASTETGGSKADWITSMLTSTAFPKLQAIFWFNQKEEVDWRVNSSVEALSAFQALGTAVLRAGR